VHVDFAQWARALTNLIENALAYSEPGSPVRVSARSLGANVIVCVEDRGPGVADGEKRQVFGKFYRGGAAAGVPSGTGLGLAITREIVASHGGDVWVEDASPHGARFVVSVPAAGKDGPS
jgi:two-component system sensor histidine kinase SenX3